MNDIINRTIERLEQSGTYLRDTNLLHQCEPGDNENVLEREQRLLSEKKARLEQRRKEAIKKLEEQGFPTLKPKIQPCEDYKSECDADRPKQTTDYTSQRIKMLGPDPDKPQNWSPYDINSDRAKFYYAPSETQGTPIPLNQPYMSDRAIRAKLAAQLSKQTEGQGITRKPISDIFPQINYHNNGLTDEEEKIAKTYLYTSAYQSDYGNSCWGKESKCRRIFPLRTLERLADPLRSIGDNSDYYPPTSSWQPKDFDASKFDAMLPRYDYINESRPYEFSTQAPRIDQIPTYSGCHSTEDRRVDDDDPYKDYKPITKVRSTVPKQAFSNPQQNIVGYTGCVVDHVKEPVDPHWPPATTGRIF